jgi:hypothetical protein
MVRTPPEREKDANNKTSYKLGYITNKVWNLHYNGKAIVRYETSLAPEKKDINYFLFSSIFLGLLFWAFAFIKAKLDKYGNNRVRA